MKQNNGNNKSSGQTKVFRNLLYGLAIVITFSSLIQSVYGCEEDYYGSYTFSYHKFMHYGLRAIFDKMGFACRNFGFRCYGEEYDALPSNEKRVIDTYNERGAHGDYFPFLPQFVIDCFCSANYNKVYSKHGSLPLKCRFPKQTVEYCNSTTSELLERCKR